MPDTYKEVNVGHFVCAVGLIRYCRKIKFFSNGGNYNEKSKSNLHSNVRGILYP